MRHPLAVFLTVFLIAACGETPASPPPLPPLPPPFTATMAPASATVAVGNSVVFAVNTSGGAIGESASWTCASSNPGIATASNTTAGCQATGVAAGDVTITATVTKGGESINVASQLTVTPPPPPPLTATMIPSSGAVVVVGYNFIFPVITSGGATGESASWTCASSNPGIATASNKTTAVSNTTNTSVGCQATGVAAGDVTITATVTKGSETVNVGSQLTVTGEPPDPLTATMIPASATVEVGEATNFTVNYSGGVTTAFASWICTSSNPTVATAIMIPNGCQVMGVAAGQATITATVTKGPETVNVDANVTVMSPPSPPSDYTIHVHDTGGGLLSGLYRAGFELAVAEWSRILWQTPTDQFTFTHDMTFKAPVVGEPDLEFKSGDILEPGLHLYIHTFTDRQWEGHGSRPYAYASLGTIDSETTSEIPIGIIGFNVAALNADFALHDALFWAGRQDRGYAIALHEIGHILGIGLGKRWTEGLTTPNPYYEPWRYYFTDPKAIEAFDRMGGTDFPETTPKIPLRDISHWDECAGHGDTMSRGRWNGIITELTLSSLSEVYVPDPTLVDHSTLDSTVWNSRYCRDGQYSPPEIGASSPIVDDGTFDRNIIFEFPIR